MPSGPSKPSRHRLENGLDVRILVRRAHPVVCAMLWYHVGAKHEERGSTGISHFLEHMMFKGSRRFAKGEIDRLTTWAGGANNAYTHHDYTAYYFNFPADCWTHALEIEADRMRGCRFDAEEFRAEKDVVIEELKMGRDDPWQGLFDEVAAHAFEVHPYRHPIIGREGDLRRLDVQQMRAYYRRHYRPDNATLVLVGDLRVREALARVRATLGRIRRPARVLDGAPAPLDEPIQRGERVLRLRGQGHLVRMVVGYRTCRRSDPEHLAFEGLEALLSHGRGSRLYEALVREHTLCTEVWCENDARRDPGLFWSAVEVCEGVDPERVRRAWLEIVEGVAARLPSAAEMRKVREGLRAIYLAEEETAFALAERIGHAAVQGGGGDDSDWLARIAALRAGDLRCAAERFLQPERRVLAIGEVER